MLTNMQLICKAINLFLYLYARDIMLNQIEFNYNQIKVEKNSEQLCSLESIVAFPLVN